MPGVEAFVAIGFKLTAAAPLASLLLALHLFLTYLCCEKESHSSIPEPGRVRHQAREPGGQAKEPGEKEYSKGTRATAELIKLMEPSLVGGERAEDKRILLYDRIFGEPEQAMPVIEQMIFEKATAECGLGNTLTNTGLAAANLQRAAVLLEGQGLDRPEPWPGRGAVCAYSTGENNSIWVPTRLVQIVKKEARLQDYDPDSPDTDVRFGDKYTTVGHSQILACSLASTFKC